MHMQSQFQLVTYLNLANISFGSSPLTYFYQRVSIASYANGWYSQRRNVRPSVRHTPVLYQNEESMRARTF